MRRKRFGLVKYGSLIFGTAHVGLCATAGQNTVYSSDWSGYFVTTSSGHAFTDVTSTWVIPTVQVPSSGTNYSAYWVGFDGAENSTVEQCGVSADVDSEGDSAYYAWYEFAPALEVDVPLIVNPGDTINAEVEYEPAKSSFGNSAYLFELTDVTSGQSYDQTQFTSSSDARSSAEWIAEAPSVNNQQSPLANFGSVTFSKDMAALDGASDQALSALGPNSVVMVQSGKSVAVPSPLNAAGEAFNINYGSAQPNFSWNNAGGAAPSDGMTWDIGGNNNWNSGTNATFYSDGSNVTFNDNNNGNYAITLNTIVSPNSVIVNNSSGSYSISGTGTISGTGSLTKTGSGRLTLSTHNSYSGGTNVSGGLLVIEPTGSTTSALPNGPLSISANGVVQLASNVNLGTGNVNITSLSITGNGALDITNSYLVINYGAGPDPITSIASWIANGYAGGTWTGTGITSSTAQAESSNYGIGYADSADPGNPANLASGTIEIKYTLLGDADLSGVVDGTDFGIVAANFNKGVSRWDQGDFNYDGVVDGADFADLAANFNRGAVGAGVSPADWTALDQFASANGLLADVPEPSSVVAITMIGLGCLRRRRAPGNLTTLESR